MSQFKKKQKVTFTSRAKSGSAVIHGVRATARGDWFDIKTDKGELLSVRAGQMTPA